MGAVTVQRAMCCRRAAGMGADWLTTIFSSFPSRQAAETTKRALRSLVGRSEKS